MLQMQDRRRLYASAESLSEVRRAAAGPVRPRGRTGDVQRGYFERPSNVLMALRGSPAAYRSGHARGGHDAIDSCAASRRRARTDEALHKGRRAEPDELVQSARAVG